MFPHNWAAIGKILTFRDKLIVALLSLSIAASFLVLVSHVYLSNTKEIPKIGGEYIEGIIGQPLYINPLLSQTSEADSDLSQLVYSGLFIYDNDGKVVPDLAQSYETSEDKRTYTVHLRNDVFWHDGEKFTANDVYFTVTALLDPMYKSPLRQNWQGVSVTVVDEYTVQFELKNPYAGFLDSLTLGMLPKHIWENIAPEKFALADYNLRPIGTGPYMFSDFQKDSNGTILTYKLVADKKNYAGESYISRMTFNFYEDEDTLLAAYNKKEVMGMSSIVPDRLGEIKNSKSTNVHELAIPRYFSLFFNETKNASLADDSVRSALIASVNRKEIIDAVLSGKAMPVYGPIFPSMNGYREPGEIAEYRLEQANKMLDDAGWKKEENGIRKKGNTEIKFEIVTTDWPELAKTADILKSQWEKIGASVEVKVLTISDLQQNYIRPREYDALLFGQAISFIPDLYPYWHSSQKRDPGLNLALFDNAEMDKLLEDVRVESDENKNAELNKKIQELIAKENPAIFLYSPTYLYPTSTALKGNETQNITLPSQRFDNVRQWYVKTKRVLK